ncbi:PKD domain-containing protein [Dyadobacter sp. CY327]|uniref:PKD domain-containing protein n=1 Tax=Dyadobacter sp. CY327 TaxID=2907301 RepID=UPI001F48BE07|nr:PKD domain-containing protein [Dyadobacter sp. CY327]MCE7070780.1 PKD domain-containing protein [Dyadobacter sp. CY327]
MRRILIQLLLLAIVFGCHQELPPQPVAKFTFTPATCVAPCTVTFTSKSENANSLEWDFNDRSEIQSGGTVTHEFVDGKNYYVKLIAKNSDGGSHGETQTVVIEAKPAALPVADFDMTPKNGGVAPLKVSFDNQSKNAATYKWRFGDKYASPADPDSSTTQNPTHTYSVPGTYTVTLTAYNVEGKPHQKTKTFEVKVEGPTASFTVDKKECEAPCEVSFTNTSTGGNEYSWDFGGEGQSSEKSPKFTFSKPGTYKVSLTVKGEGGEKTTQESVTIKPKSLSVSAIQIKSEYNISSDIISDASGNIYVCGSTIGTTVFGNGITGSAGYISSRNTDFYVAKYSPSGECLWGNVYGSAGDDHANGLALDNANNVYVTGHIGGTPRISGFNFRGDRDGFVMKLNSNGISGWFKNFGGPGNDQGRSIGFYQTAQGPRVYMAGIVTGSSSKSDIFFGNETYSANGQDICLVLYDTEDGEVGRPSIGGGVGLQSVASMAIDDEGSAYLVGSFEGSLSIYGTRNSWGKSDMFVAKWDASWSSWSASSNFGFETDDFGYDIALDKSKNIYIIGIESSNSTQAPILSVRACRISSSLSFETLWYKFGTGKSYAGGIDVTGEGDVIFTGSYSDSYNYPGAAEAFEANGSTDAIICEVKKENGELTGKFQVSVGGKSEDRATSVCVAPDGTVYSTGWFQGTASFTGVELVNYGIMPNTYIAKYKY